jgi:hypothetical protein
MILPFRPWAEAAIEHMLGHSGTLMFVDGGGGKTRVVLEAFFQAREHCDSERLLVIAPMKVAANVWPEEIKKWKYPFRYQVLTTKTKTIKDRDVYLVHFEAIPWLFGKPDTARKMWTLGAWDSLDWPQKPDWVHIDEIHHFKRATGVRAKTYSRFADTFARRTGGTGSPASNGYEGLHGIVKAVDGGRALGSLDDRAGTWKSGVTQFRRRYFRAQQSYARHWVTYELQDGAASEIEEAIRPLVICATDADWADELPVVTSETISVTLPPDARHAYDLMRREAVMESGGEDLAFAEEATNSKLRQICNGRVYTSRQWEARDGRHLELHDAKIDALRTLVGTQQTIVVYEFKHDREAIKMMLAGSDAVFGVLDGVDDYDVIKRWNKKDIQVLLMYPTEGLNLQQGGNRIVWYGPPHDWLKYDQTNRRLARLGQPEDTVFVYHIAAKGTIEQRVSTRLREKEAEERRLKEALK